MLNKELLNKFVTATPVDSDESKQGWIIAIFKSNLFVIKEQNEHIHVCEGEPTIMNNQPEKKI